MAFREDECHLRTGYAAENISRLRRIALNLLKHDTKTKAGIAAKRKRCGWDEGYLVAVISQSTDQYD